MLELVPVACCWLVGVVCGVASPLAALSLFLPSKGSFLFAVWMWMFGSLPYHGVGVWVQGIPRAINGKRPVFV